MTNFDYNVSQGAMLRQVDEAGFAVVDANLYLDTHPCDAAAIDYYNQMLAAYKSAAAAYEECAHKCGYMKKDWNFLLILKNPMHRWHSS